MTEALSWPQGEIHSVIQLCETTMLGFALGFSFAVVLMALLAIAFLNLVVNDGVWYLP